MKFGNLFAAQLNKFPNLSLKNRVTSDFLAIDKT